MQQQKKPESNKKRIQKKFDRRKKPNFKKIQIQKSTQKRVKINCKACKWLFSLLNIQSSILRVAKKFDLKVSLTEKIDKKQEKPDKKKSF